jgi:hypothetical protein
MSVRSPLGGTQPLSRGSLAGTWFQFTVYFRVTPESDVYRAKQYQAEHRIEQALKTQFALEGPAASRAFLHPFGVYI